MYRTSRTAVVVHFKENYDLSDHRGWRVLGTITEESIGPIPIPPNTGKYWPIPNTPIPVSFEPYLWVTFSAQTTYAFRVLRLRGLSNAALQLQLVYWATIFVRVTYAATASTQWLTVSDDLDTAWSASRRSVNCATLQTMNYIVIFYDPIMYCTRYYHHHPSRHNATSQTSCALFSYSCPNTQLSYLTVIL